MGNFIIDENDENEASAIHSLLSLLIIFSFNSDPLGDVTLEMERR